MLIRFGNSIGKLEWWTPNIKGKRKHPLAAWKWFFQLGSSWLSWIKRIGEKQKLLFQPEPNLSVSNSQQLMFQDCRNINYGINKWE